MYRLITITAVLVAMCAGTASASVKRVGPDYGDRVTVHNCPTRNACPVDFQGSPFGGIWIVRNVRIVGCDAEDSCRYGWHRRAETVTITRDRH